MTRAPIVLTLALLTAIITACGKADSPTTPGGTGPMIREVQPGVILAGSQVQTITVNGDNFSTGLTLAVVRPDNTTLTFAASDLQTVTTNSFRASMVFEQLGNYGFVVRSASGTNSPNFNLAVQSSLNAPRLTSVAPSSTPLSTVPQLVLINGDSLGGISSVSVTDPDGFVTVLAVDQLGLVTSTSFQLTFVPNKRGAWSFSATTSGGAASNAVVIAVG